MSQSKLQLTITKINNSYSVEMRDHYSNYACVYEPSVVMAMSYALDWFKKADEREQANQIRGKAIQEKLNLKKLNL